MAKENFDLWSRQLDWHLKRRTLLTRQDAGIEDEEVKAAFSRGLSPLDYVIEIIEAGGLDDVVADPWTGPSEQYWKNWERQNPLPGVHSA